MKLRQLIESREALGALLKNPLPISIGWTLKQFLVKQAYWKIESWSQCVCIGSVSIFWIFALGYASTK